jgi:hypothetical protein
MKEYGGRRGDAFMRIDYDREKRDHRVIDDICGGFTDHKS